MLEWAKAIHQAIGIESPYLFVGVFALFGLLLFGGTAWIVDHGYRVKIDQERTDPPVTKKDEPAITTSNASPLHSTKKKKPQSQSPPASQIGSDNTLVNVPVPQNMGSGNTFIGPTDANGDTIYTKGGTAIGKGACADPTSIAIGAGAHAGDCSPPAKKQDSPTTPPRN
jgi:hypothetical protein